jgi:hypothetical protein
MVLDRLCDLVVRVRGYRSGGPGSIPGTTRKKSFSLVLVFSFSMVLSHIFCNVGYKGEQTIYVTVCVVAVVCVRWRWGVKVPTWRQLYAVTITGELYSSKHITFRTVKHFRELPTHLKRIFRVMKNTKVHEVNISDFEF